MSDENFNEFLNKRVVITGASSGIGQSVANYFLNCGAKVVLIGQDLNSMKRYCENHQFHNAIIMKADITKDIHVYDLKSSIAEQFNSIDILINCAGVKLGGDLEKTFPQEFDYTVDINLRSVFLLMKNLYEFFNPEGSSIINLSCLYGTRPCCGMLSYAMSKAGLETLTKYAAADFSVKNIRVNAITSCPVYSNSLRLVKLTKEEIDIFEKKMAAAIPMGRMAHPHDIVKVVSFLASQRSSKITGQIIKVDGGRGLTSSGYVQYKGIRHMNSRFEPDGMNFTDWLGGIKKIFSSDKPFQPIENSMELRKFVMEKINESNFATTDSDAHLNVFSNYKKVDVSDDEENKK